MKLYIHHYMWRYQFLGKNDSLTVVFDPGVRNDGNVILVSDGVKINMYLDRIG